MPKLYGYLILLVAALALVGFGLTRAYNHGVDVERGRWERAQAKAATQAHRQEQSDTRASEGVADATRTQAAEQAATTDATTASSIETIRYVYRNAKPAACTPGGPAAIPAGVLDEIDQAVRAVTAAKG
jgi:hypothetical protein